MCKAQNIRRFAIGGGCAINMYIKEKDFKNKLPGFYCQLLALLGKLKFVGKHYYLLTGEKVGN